MMSEVFVRVAVRIRPLRPREKLHKHRECVQLVPDSTQVMFGSDRLFSFDHALGPTATQDEVYTSSVQPLVQYLLTGYNATVFCYGQTGSGKTYTLEGGGGEADEEGGIVDRVAQDLFLFLEEKKRNTDNMETTVWVSYLELYREELRDLLEQPTVQKVFHIRDDEKGNTVVVGAKEVVVTSAEELLRVVQAGRLLRHIASTGMNERSSRSHTIISLKVAHCSNSENSSLKSVQTSKLCLVDLAGSERAGKTGNTGVRFKESVRINTGLLALSKVISALSEPARTHHSTHIPYRDAKITRLLRDSLGGTAHTLMVVCVSPSHQSADETLGALQFASKARYIRNCPRATCTVVKSSSIARMAELDLEVQTLRELLKEKELEVHRERTGGEIVESLRQYQLLTEEAAALLEDISGPPLSPSLKQQLQDWQERLTVVSNSHPIANMKNSEGGGDQSDHDTVVKLREELSRYQEALNYKEQLLEQKDVALRQTKTDLEKLLLDSKVSFQVLEQEKERNRLQIEQLVELQVVNDHLRNEITALKSAISGGPRERDAPKKPDKRPHSVPVSRNSSGDPLHRKIQSSPAEFTLERAMTAFKVRKNLRLAEFDDNDGMFLPIRQREAERKGRSPDCEKEREGNDEDEETVSNMSLQDSWIIRQNPCLLPQGNKEPKRNQPRIPLAAAQKIIKDLSVNIRMKEELILALDKTDNLIQAVDAGDECQPGILGALSSQNHQIRTEVYQGLQHMKLERDQLQTNVRQQTQTTDSEAITQSQVYESSWLEQQEEKELQNRADLQELQEEMRSREEVVLRRESYLQEKNKLEVKKLRSSKVLGQNLLRVSMQLKSVEEQLQGRSERGVTKEELKRERDQLKKQKENIDAQLKENKVLTAEEEYSLLQLEEAIEALDGALEFKSRFIEDKKKLLLSEPLPVCGVIRKLKELSSPEATELLVKYFNKVVGLREKERCLHVHCEELKLHVGELQTALGDMEISMKHVALGADRKFTKQCKDYQKNIELLTIKLQDDHTGQQMRSVHERLQHLEKELFYYKSYSRQLKQKLKEPACNQSLHEQVQTKHTAHVEARTTKSLIRTERVQSQKPAAATLTKLQSGQRYCKAQNERHTLGSLSSDLQEQNTKMLEYSQIQTQRETQDRNAVVAGDCGQSLELTPVRLCRRKLRQISVSDLQVSDPITGRPQSDVDKTGSILQDSLELP